ncbi:hypothetical protein DXG03_007247 [Asterophora parasitica]|uniref:Uncharacterized protein n=1 Tax=Asterophora parasitica TaxID=117018 RepID=A0A9P7K9B3_9AGAR|nr:hypothetical protein DXG03_007247 [Asterophora parasitica]
MALISGGPFASPFSVAPIYASQLVFGPAGLVSTVRAEPSITTPRPAKTPHRTAPHHVQSVSASESGVRPPPTSSQPLQTFSSHLPTSSGVYYSLTLSTTAASSTTSETGIVWSSSSSIVSTSAPLSSSSVIPFLVSPSITTIVSSTAESPTIASSSLTSQATTESSSTDASTDTLSTSPLPSSVPAVDEDVTSRDANHHAPFYVAIVVGAIVAVGLVAAILAWMIRLRLHAKRRHSALNVPWAHHVHEDGLEEGCDAMFIGKPIDRIGSGDISSQDAIPWEPRGDRDVGEPKRSNSYVRGSRSSHLFNPFANTPPYPVVAESVAPYQMPMQTDPDGSLDGYHSAASTLGPLQVANMAPGDASPGTPPPEPHDASPPRFLGLNGESLRVPWTSMGRSASRRQGGTGNWEHLPMPGETQKSDGTAVATYDSWTASLKSNLTNAFNAVASTLPSGPSLMKSSGAHDDDILSPRPQQGAGSRSMTARSNFSGVSFNGNPLSRNTTGSSMPWSLEERDDGTGRVHFHGRALNGYGYGRPQMLGSLATLDFPSSAGTSIYRASTQDSHAPLVARLPQSALLRPDAFSHIPQYSWGRQGLLSTQGSVSRASSVYSMASKISGVSSQAPAPRLPIVSRHSTMRIDALQTVSEKKEEDGAVEQRPSFVERSSSSGCSFNSYYYGSDAASGVSGDVAETDETAHKAIAGRRRKLSKAV